MLMLAAFSLMIGLSMITYFIIFANKMKHFVVFGIITLLFTIVFPSILLYAMQC